MEENTAQTSKQVSATVCFNCGTTTTPLWRRTPSGETICNACGLYLKAKNTLRPPSMKRNKQKQFNEHMDTLTLTAIDAATAPGGSCPGNGQCNGTGGSPSCAGCPAFNQHQANRHSLICANCRTTTTPLWRRDNEGNTICNACGLYYKLHNVHRPVSMKRTMIKRRKRVIVSDKGTNEDGEEDELESSSSEEQEEEPTTKSGSSVPPIEDYIKPKRLPPPHPPPPPPPPSSGLPAPPTTPPASSSKRFDPLFDYRSSPRSNKESPYQDLNEFDEAMTRLERLRRRVLPEQSKMLSQLTSELEDIVEKAQHILDK
jgi:transcription initiation factor TFIIIB Brf1 subunit/transcription initiation factor TFIIB